MNRYFEEHKSISTFAIVRHNNKQKYHFLCFPQGSLEGHMHIDGFGISGYRSFGNSHQKIGPFNKVNLFAGQNNSGKSNILSFIRHKYSLFARSVTTGARFSSHFKDFDRHIGFTDENARFTLGVKLGGANFKALVAKFEGDNFNKTHIERMLIGISELSSDSTIWLPYLLDRNQNLFQFDNDFLKDVLTKTGIQPGVWQQLASRLSGSPVYADAAQLDRFVSIVLKHVVSSVPEASNVKFVGAIREIGAAKVGREEDDFSGAGLIERLGELQSPRIQNYHDKEKFEKINKFLRWVVSNETARLAIPHDNSTINVTIDGRTLTLQSLGTGIHEVIILASAATIWENSVLCIEEPELHLHPLLQRKLLRYLLHSTSNQYFITTHSAHLLDISESAIFHTRMQGGETNIERAISDSKKSLICADLGYRASDILQANCIVWVEGPSDRIYVNHWIKSIDPDLIEGIHYSIMFYGGRLLSHLSGDDPAIDEFISLRKINRFITIVIDSDKRSRQAPINNTKKRLKDEFDKGPGFAWVTKGREIENYIDESVLNDAIAKIHPKSKRVAELGQFGTQTKLYTASKEIREVDKVRVAHEVVARPANLSILDLRQQAVRLVEFIRSANDSNVYPLPS